MANNRSRNNRRDEDTKPSYPFASTLTIAGNLTGDPREMGKDGSSCGLTVAANYYDSYNDVEGVFFVGVTVSGGYAAWALDNLSKGDRVIVSGKAYGNLWENKDGDEQQDIQINWADFIAPDNRFYSGDDDDRRSSRRSSSRSSGGRGRGRARDEDDDLDDDDDEEEEAPRRSRRPAPEGGARRRRRAVSDVEN